MRPSDSENLASDPIIIDYCLHRKELDIPSLRIQNIYLVIGEKYDGHVFCKFRIA